MQGQWRIAFLGSAAQVERYLEMAENGQFACRWGDLGQLAEENGYESSSMEGKSALILRSSNDGNISGFLDMLEMVHAKLPEMEIILATLATDFPEDGWDVTHWRAGESTYRTGTLAWSGMGRGGGRRLGRGGGRGFGSGFRCFGRTLRRSGLFLKKTFLNILLAERGGFL